MRLDPVVVPLFRLEPVAWAAPDPHGFDAILLTSANALRLAGEQTQRLRGLPVHAVGQATAHEAREAGFHVASTGDAGVEQLLGSIEPGSRLLHLCGEDRRQVQAPGQAITELVVYRAAAVPARLEPRELEGQVGAVHSPRAAARLAELIDADTRATVRLAAISTAAADAAGAGWEEVDTARLPDDASLLACAVRLCEKP